MIKLLIMVNPYPIALLLGMLLVGPAALFGQSLSGEQRAVFQVVTELFDAMRAGDSDRAAAVFHPQARLFSAPSEKLGQTRAAPASEWVEAIGRPRSEVWNEKLWTQEVRIDGHLATVWTEYSFFLDDQLKHCGVNTFQLVRDGGPWKIVSVTDTRRETGCLRSKADQEAQLDQLLNDWHRAAALADEDTFFGLMEPESVYLGTDVRENWRRDDLRKWSAEYFEGSSAWEFSPNHRHWFFSADGQTAWFDEVLDTWMGPCRGSGVMQKQADGSWKLMHYNLAVLVPNEKMDEYKKLIGKG